MCIHAVAKFEFELYMLIIYIHAMINFEYILFIYYGKFTVEVVLD